MTATRWLKSGADGGGGYFFLLPRGDEHAVGVELVRPERKGGELRVESCERQRFQFWVGGGEGVGDGGGSRCG